MLNLYFVAGLLSSAATAWPGWVSYNDSFQNNTGIPYSPALNESCTACVRGGFDACLYFTNDTIEGPMTTLKCNNFTTTPEINDTLIAESMNGWFCSYGVAAQTNAIVSGCSPRDNQKVNQSLALCGEYMIDLTGSEPLQSRALSNLPLYASCTYRVYSTCGYPSARLTL